MAKQSAGLLPYRWRDGKLEVLLVHPGGPFWRKKDAGAWSIAKGELSQDEDALEGAKREFKEETGISVEGHFLPLAPVRQRGGKVVRAWAVECDIEATRIQSNTFLLELPRHSGQWREVPEIDRAEWFTIELAREKVLASQRPLVDELVLRLSQEGECA